MNVQHLAGFAAGISPVLALACKVTGCIFKNSAACFKSIVSMTSSFISHPPIVHGRLWHSQSFDVYR